MADPQHTPELDAFDRLTIAAYRTGLVLASAGLGGSSVALATGASVDAAWSALVMGVVLCVADLHLYDKRIRWTIGWLAWAGLLVRVLAGLSGRGAEGWIAGLGDGLLLAALSAVVLKEWFCFRIPLVRATPVVLAIGVIAVTAGAELVAAVTYGLAALGVAAVAVAKLQMPLGHDVGDRSRYQV